MKKSLMLLLCGSLCFTSGRLVAAELIEAANINFGPKRPSPATGTEAQEPATPQPPQPPAPIAAPIPPPPPAPVVAPVPPPEPPPAVYVEPTGVPPAITTAASPANTEIEQVAREELVRRQEAQLAAQALVRQGQTAYDAGQYEDAAAKFEAALQTLPEAPATQADRDEAIDGVVRANYRLADDALTAGDLERARTYAKKALQYDPTSRAASSILSRAERKERAVVPPEEVPPTPPHREEEFLAKRNRIKELFRESRILINSGQYDRAEESLEQILVIDPYNSDARQYMDVLNQRRLKAATIGQETSRSLRLWEVTKGWVPPINLSRQEMERLTGGEGPIDKLAANKALINSKLNSIVLEQINFRDADIRDVLNFLSEESRRLDKIEADPAKRGVNILIQAGESGAATAPVLPTLPESLPPMPEVGGTEPDAGLSPLPAPPISPEPAVSASTAPRITLTLRNIPLIEALKYVTTAAGLKFRVESHAVLILPKDALEEELLTRTYRIDPSVLERVQGEAAETREITGDEEFRGLGEGAGTIGTFADVKKLFEDAGVPFPPGSSLSYYPRTSTIVVKNTPQNLEDFEKVLDAINVIPNQVEIEARFIDVAQSDLDELGFDWKVGHYLFGEYQTLGGNTAFADAPNLAQGQGRITGGLRDSTIVQASGVESLLGTGLSPSPNNIATLRGILTNPQFEVIVRALSQKKSTDVLSAPKITTISGNAAQIRVVQEFIYPTEFEQQVGDFVVSQIPTTFKTRELGVLLNVTPQVGPDGYTINLTLIPEVSEFLGFVDYSSGTDVGSVLTNQTAVSAASVTAKILQPLFASRNLATSIMIWDGQTVVLGGLLREDVQKIDDKVPFLGDIPLVGRLFRSKVDSRSKRNLLVFVTARLIDPAGNLVHPPEPVRILKP